MSEINFRDAGDTQKLAELESKLSALEAALEAHQLKSEEFINPFHADLLRRLDERLIDEDNGQEDDENEEEAEIGELDQSFIQVISSGPEFSVHWITVDSSAETPSFNSIDQIDTFEKVQQAFKEAVEYRDLDDNELRKVNHSDLMVLLSRADPNTEKEEGAGESDDGWITAWDGRQACYYIGQVANVSDTIQDVEPEPEEGERYIAGKAAALHEGDSREIVVWEHCTFANGDAYLTYVQSVDHKVESRFEQLVIVDEDSEDDGVGNAIYDIYAKQKLGRANINKGRVVKIETSDQASNWTNDHIIGSIYVPNSFVRYTCTPEGCIEDPGGEYKTLEECAEACDEPQYYYDIYLSWTGENGYRDLDTSLRIADRNGGEHVLGYSCGGTTNDYAVWVSNDITTTSGYEEYHISSNNFSEFWLYAGWYEPYNRNSTGGSTIQVEIYNQGALQSSQSFLVTEKISGCAANTYDSKLVGNVKNTAQEVPFTLNF